jgi:hypothetical protein
VFSAQSGFEFGDWFAKQMFDRRNGRLWAVADLDGLQTAIADHFDDGDFAAANQPGGMSTYERT